MAQASKQAKIYRLFLSVNNKVRTTLGFSSVGIGEKATADQPSRGLLGYVRFCKESCKSPILKAGFTLVEMAIVLVIMGLLTGGILVGMDLIRGAEIRSISTQKEATVAAVYTFKNKYNGLPGDLKDAQTFFGAAADCTAAQTTLATCNGNGNDMLENINPSGTVGYEYFLFWKHLANAGLVPGNFTGVTDGATAWSVTARNSPSGKISGSLWEASYMWDNNGIYNWAFNGRYGNMLQYGIVSIDTSPQGSVLTAKEMLAMDKKIDDGKPGTGKLRAGLFNNCVVKADGVTGAVSADTDTALYNYSVSTGKQCALIFPEVF